MILKAARAGLLIILAALVTPAWAAVPELINFQGKLTDASGKAVTNAVPMVFRLYTSASGVISSWTETQIVTPDSYGIYSVQLGEVTPLNVDFSVGYWLGVTVGTDSEMLPRYRMVPSVYALYALNSSTAATATNLTGLTATIANLNSITGTLGTAAFTATGAYATAAQGTKADAALPSADFTDAAVTGKLITGYTSGAGTITSTDTILTAINKLDGNMVGKGNGTVTGVTGTAPVVSSGGTAPVISMPAATSLNAGYATAAHISAIEANTSKVTNATHTGDATGATALTVKGINGVALSGLATGILKNTTTTGAPSIAVAGIDYLAPAGNGTALQFGSGVLKSTFTAVPDAANYALYLSSGLYLADGGVRWADGTVSTSAVAAGGGADIYWTGTAVNLVAADGRAALGLGNVDNTSDLDKPISTTTLTALGLKADLKSAVRSVAASTPLDSTDFGKTITVTAAATITLPAESGADIGATITIVKAGAGAVIIAAGTGYTIADSAAGGTIYNNVAAETYATITLRLISGTEWAILGGNGSWTVTI